MIGVPALILAASYGYLAWEHGTLWLFDRVVHEGGKHTFLGTVFYFEHFLREIPIDLLMALGVTGWWCFVGGQVSGHSYERFEGVEEAQDRRLELDSRPRHAAFWSSARSMGQHWRRHSAFAAAVILICFAIGWSVVPFGWEQVRLDLFQYRTRDDLVAFGSHWHSHWLHLVFMLPAAAILPLVRAELMIDASKSDLIDEDTRKSGVIMLGAWIMLFAGLTGVFGLSPMSFTDPRYLGHQAREIATHALLTMPLAWAALLLRARRRNRSMVHPSGVRPGAETDHGNEGPGDTSRGRGIRFGSRDDDFDAASPVREMEASFHHSAPGAAAGWRKHPLLYALIATVLAASIPLWITWKLRGIDVLAVAAKQSSYADLLASHAFEHTLDYVLVVLLVLAITRFVDCES